MVVRDLFVAGRDRSRRFGQAGNRRVAGDVARRFRPGALARVDLGHRAPWTDSLRATMGVVSNVRLETGMVSIRSKHKEK